MRIIWRQSIEKSSANFFQVLREYQFNENLFKLIRVINHTISRPIWTRTDEERYHSKKMGHDCSRCLPKKKRTFVNQVNFFYPSSVSDQISFRFQENSIYVIVMKYCYCIPKSGRTIVFMNPTKCFWELLSNWPNTSARKINLFLLLALWHE